MSDGGLQVLDGTQLIAAELSSSFGGDLAGERLLEIAAARAAACMYGLSLPENLKTSALQRLDSELSALPRQHRVDKDQAERFLRGFITAIADELRDDPLMVSVLDGNTIRLFLEDEDDFAMLAENLFTDLDTKDEGKLSKSEVQNALVHMGVEMGVPCVTDFPMINDLLKKHEAEGEEKLGQAQFAQLLQPILQDLADALAVKPVTVVQNVKIINGSKLRKILADKNQLNEVTEKMYQQKNDHSKGQDCTATVRSYLEKNGEDLGLPPLESNEAVSLLYDAIFSDIDKEKRDVELGKNEFGDLVKQILQKFAEQLQANPIFHDALN